MSYFRLRDIYLHALWELPPQDANYSLLWRCIKTNFAKNLNRTGVPIVKNSRSEYQLWQKRFWEHTIRGEIDFERHVNYIHYNPVKHGYVKKVADWPCSTFHRYVRDGLLSKNWCQDEDLYND